MDLLPGFDDHTVDVDEIAIRARTAGNGPPLLLLHGHPQTHVMWHRVAPRLARHFTVVVTDLRGYGDSSKPQGGPPYDAYSKRTMGRDQVNVMRELGFGRFFVCGHDRGARVAYRMALDWPHVVRKLAVLDIIPTGEAWRRADRDFGLGFWHWFFLAQPQPLPETLIGAAPEAFYFREPQAFFDERALSEYRRCIHRPETIHGMCEDYRSGATVDYVLDEQDRGRKRIECPVLVLWSRAGELEQWYDVLDVWRDWADDVRGGPVDAGHYMAEEAPDVIAEELERFLR